MVSVLAGALIGNSAYAAAGGKGAKGLIIGDFTGLSSNFIGTLNEGELKNRRQYQGAYSEYDEDIQWNIRTLLV